MTFKMSESESDVSTCLSKLSNLLTVCGTSSKTVHEYIVSLFRYLQISQISTLIICAFAGDNSQFVNYSQKLGSILAAVTGCV